MGARTAPAYRVFLFLSVVPLLMLAWALRSSALFGMALTALAYLASARRTARLRAQGLSVRRRVHPNAFEDETVEVQVVIENRSRRTVHLLEVSDTFGASIADQHLLLDPGPLGPGRRRRLGYRTSCSRHWGVYSVGPSAIVASDPMGLFQAERPGMAAESFAVFPRVYDVPAFDRLGTRASLAPQEASMARPGQSASYLGVREYRPGDERRRIHWAATARRGVLVVKEYEVDLAPYFTLFLDLESRNRAGTGKKSTIEYLVRTAASVLWSAVRRGDFVQVFAEGAKPLYVAPGQGEFQFVQGVYELIRARQDGSLPILDLVDRYRGQIPRGSVAALLSASTAIDEIHLAMTLSAFREQGTRPLLLFIDSDSFVPVSRWPEPRVRAERRAQDRIAHLQAENIPGAVLGAGHDLRRELERPDLLGEHR